MNLVTKTAKTQTEIQFEMSVNGHQATRRNIPKHGSLYIHRRHDLKFLVSLRLAEEREETIS